MNCPNMTPEQRIDDAVVKAKMLFLPQARNPQEAKDIARNIEAAGDNIKALTALVYDKNLLKSLAYELLSKMR